VSGYRRGDRTIVGAYYERIPEGRGYHTAGNGRIQEGRTTRGYRGGGGIIQEGGQDTGGACSTPRTGKGVNPGKGVGGRGRGE